MTTLREALHVVPLNDLREHEARTTCWCKPTEDDEWPDIWVHHSMDRREEYEEGRERS
jgi:nicotinamide mononucleotide adenylyltransferase